MATTDDQLQAAADLVENQFGLGLFFEALHNEGIDPQTELEMDALVKMAQQVLVDRPLEKAHNAGSPILKAAGVMFKAAAEKQAAEQNPYDLDGIVARALAAHPQLGEAADVLNRAQAQG